MSLLGGLYPVLSSDYIYIENAAGRVGGRRLRARAHSTCATRGGVRNLLQCLSSSCRSWLLLVCKVLCCFSFETQVGTSVIRRLLIIAPGPRGKGSLLSLLPPLPHTHASMTPRYLR